jgi:hypothetical protein
VKPIAENKMSVPYIDQSVCPDVDAPEDFATSEAKANYVHRICSAWDFDVYPEPETFALFKTWKDIFDAYPLPESPAYHTFRCLFHWNSVPMIQNSFVHLTYQILDKLEGRESDPMIPFV